MATTLQNIDPALGLMKEFSRKTLGTTAAIHKMRQDVIFTDGKVPAKYKTLAAALWSISARCEPCIRFYIQEAAKLGATEEELGEFLAVGSLLFDLDGINVRAVGGGHDADASSSCEWVREAGTGDWNCNPRWTESVSRCHRRSVCSEPVSARHRALPRPETLGLFHL